MTNTTRRRNTERTLTAAAGPSPREPYRHALARRKAAAPKAERSGLLFIELRMVKSSHLAFRHHEGGGSRTTRSGVRCSSHSGRCHYLISIENQRTKSASCVVEKPFAMIEGALVLEEAGRAPLGPLVGGGAGGGRGAGTTHTHTTSTSTVPVSLLTSASALWGLFF